MSFKNIFQILLKERLRALEGWLKFTTFTQEIYFILVYAQATL